MYLLTATNSYPLAMVLAFGFASYFAITLYSLLRGQKTLTVILLSKERAGRCTQNIHTAEGAHPSRIFRSAYIELARKSLDISLFINISGYQMRPGYRIYIPLYYLYSAMVRADVTRNIAASPGLYVGRN